MTKKSTKMVCPTCGKGTIPADLAEFGRRTCDRCDPDPKHRGLVFCCVTTGWVKPAVAFDCRWDAYSGWDRD